MSKIFIVWHKKYTEFIKIKKEKNPTKPKNDIVINNKQMNWTDHA